MNDKFGIILGRQNSGGGGSGSNPFDQNLNTTNSPTFNGLTISPFTQGSVIFAGSSGLLSQNNENFYWDD